MFEHDCKVCGNIAVLVAAGHWLNDQISSPGWLKNDHHSMSSRLLLGSAQPPVYWVPGTLSTVVKWKVCGGDNSPPTSAKAKETRVFISTPISLHGVCLIS
jgi:hypothetical protein